MNRSKLRENIFKLLYTAEFQEKEEMPQQMSLYFTYSDDEAVELAKRFGRDQSPSFINGILGKLAREEDEK